MISKMKPPKLYLDMEKDELIKDILKKDKLIGKLEKEKDNLEKEKDNLEKEKDNLEKELKKYKNANTPSSSNKHIKPNTKGVKAKKGAKRGAPKGHKGATFIWPEIEKFIPLFAKRCGHCRSSNIEPTGYVKKKRVVSFAKPKIVAKEYCQEEYRCLDCNELTLASHKDILEKGIYDKTIQSMVNYFKFKGRMPLKLVADVMNSMFNVPITAPTCLEITRRASDKLEPYYYELEERAKGEELIQADETSHSVNGINYWVWVFCNAMFSLFKFNRERGGDIVERTLGKGFKGVIVSDGWRTYQVYSEDNNIRHQRCWDHLKREVKAECKEKHPEIYRWFCDIYLMVKKAKEYKQEKRRIAMYYKCKAELSRVIASMNAHKNLRKLATKINNGGDNWFTTILHPHVPMDNNEAERAIRPIVIMRKIIGCLRSDLGMRNYEVMMSLIATWEKQGKNIFYTLQNTI
jgi:transposase